MNQFITVAAILTFGVQLLMVINFFYSIWYGRKVTDKNPWKATTLEWTTPVIAGHGNWEGNLPSVQRWAYDYGKDGRDFITQIEPMSDEEKKNSTH
ncbi:MAG: hypothetical protein HC892_19365 [Saprospiraceae bacterium]|nr:hypothetical protein [Saprospiraceae bacterium]